MFIFEMFQRKKMKTLQVNSMGQAFYLFIFYLFYSKILAKKHMNAKDFLVLSITVL